MLNYIRLSYNIFPIFYIILPTHPVIKIEVIKIKVIKIE